MHARAHIVAVILSYFRFDLYCNDENAHSPLINNYLHSQNPYRALRVRGVPMPFGDFDVQPRKGVTRGSVAVWARWRLGVVIIVVSNFASRYFPGRRQFLLLNRL